MRGREFLGGGYDEGLGRGITPCGARYFARGGKVTKAPPGPRSRTPGVSHRGAAGNGPAREKDRTPLYSPPAAALLYEIGLDYPLFQARLACTVRKVGAADGEDQNLPIFAPTARDTGRLEVQACQLTLRLPQLSRRGAISHKKAPCLFDHRPAPSGRGLSCILTFTRADCDLIPM